MYQLFTVFEIITEFRIEDKDIFYPYIDNFLNIIMLPKWRIDTSLILKVSFLLTRLYILPIQTTQFITSKDDKKTSGKKYSNYIKKYNKIIIQLKYSLPDENISLYRFPGNVGINNMTTLYSYILIDNNHYENEINKNIEGRIEYEKVEILYQLIKSIIFFYLDYFKLNKTEPKPKPELYAFKYMIFDFINEIKYSKIFRSGYDSAVTYFFDFIANKNSKINAKWFIYLILKKGIELGKVDFALTYYNLIVNCDEFFLNKKKVINIYEKQQKQGTIKL